MASSSTRLTRGFARCNQSNRLPRSQDFGGKRGLIDRSNLGPFEQKFGGKRGFSRADDRGRGGTRGSARAGFGRDAGKESEAVGVAGEWRREITNASRGNHYGNQRRGTAEVGRESSTDRPQPVEEVLMEIQDDSTSEDEGQPDILLKLSYVKVESFAKRNAADVLICLCLKDKADQLL